MKIIYVWNIWTHMTKFVLIVFFKVIIIYKGLLGFVKKRSFF